MKPKRTDQSPAPSPAPSSPKHSSQDVTHALSLRHLRFGWWALLVFLTLGIVLEVLHGLKAGAYLNVSQSTRRLLWTLAHAHGTLLALINLGFAWTLRWIPSWPELPQARASACLRAASILLPSGFFLGGWFHHEGDPGIGILLVPVGALLLLLAVLWTALALRKASA